MFLFCLGKTIGFLFFLSLNFYLLKWIQRLIMWFGLDLWNSGFI